MKMFDASALRGRYGGRAGGTAIKAGDRVRITTSDGERRKGVVDEVIDADGVKRLRVRLDAVGSEEVDEVEEDMENTSNVIEVPMADANVKKLVRRSAGTL